MKKIIILVAVIAIAYFGFNCINSNDNAKASTEENNWVSLFDGKTFKGWHNYMSDSISDEWQIENGAMVFNPNPDKDHGINNLVTDKDYTDFILSLEWKISEGGNSGIFWGVLEDKNYNVPYQTGPEVQVLDNINHPDGEKETHRSGALYDMIAPSQDVVKKVGAWNTCVIEINHKTNSGKIWLNDINVVSFPVNGKQWGEMISKSKFKDWPGFGKFKTGKIGLQDHESKVSFRNIKIKEL